MKSVRADGQEQHASCAPFNEELTQLLPAMRRRALGLCRDANEADDIVQDAVVRALRFESSFRHGTNLRAWLSQIVFSVFITRRRRQTRERRALTTITGDPCSWTHPDPAPVMTALTPSVRAALAELPAGFAAVVGLVDLGDHEYKDAADALGVPVGTVMSRLHRARKALRGRLESDFAPTPQAA